MKLRAPQSPHMAFSADVDTLMFRGCAGNDSEREPAPLFILIHQEGRIPRTLIGVIHSCDRHSKQLCSHTGSATAAVRSCLSSPAQVLKVEPRLWSCSPLFGHTGPPSRGLCSLAALHPNKPLPEELCHAPLSLVCRHANAANNPFHLIASWHEFEWLSRQLKNRFAVKTEVLYHHPSIRAHAHPPGRTALSKMRIAIYPRSLPGSLCVASAERKLEKQEFKE